jgi:hypothetical protein
MVTLAQVTRLEARIAAPADKMNQVRAFTTRSNWSGSKPTGACWTVTAIPLSDGRVSSR